MKVSDLSPVIAPERVAAQQAASTAVQGTPDRVSVNATRNAEASVSAARRSTGTDRASRMKELEASVRSGSYAPDPGRVAEQILSDAEVDARLKAIISH
jgi:anti-sigma28 factor (negative regulator of flagellin synthesis)